MIKLITGNRAAALGAVLCRPKFISAYPITPQTTISEYLAGFCADGTLNAKYMNVESEHSALSACIGASVTGVRVFTATSSHGLALMHEMLHITSFMRLPIVMVVVNRAIGLWNIHGEQTDALSQRDTGWLQIYCENGQEVIDTVIQAYNISEKVSLPTMVCLDGFILSHTSELVDIPEAVSVDHFLPKSKPLSKLDVKNPRMFGAPVSPEYFLEFRYKAQEAMEKALPVVAEVDARFGEQFGRSYGLVEGYKTEDAKLVVVSVGTAASTTRIVIDELREAGEKIGMLKIRLFRPFPKTEVIKALKHVEKVAVIDRDLSPGQGGIFAEEIRSALYSSTRKPKVYGFIAGLGGRDITPDTIRQIINITSSTDQPREITWVGLKR